MAGSCSNSSEEEHAILFGALDVLQKIDDEKRKTILRNEKDGGFAQELRGAGRSAHFML